MPLLDATEVGACCDARGTATAERTVASVCNAGAELQPGCNHCAAPANDWRVAAPAG